MSTCAQCGARYPEPASSCEERFRALLALDHSRHEPWGKLHGLAFACFTLQHPEGQSREALERCWVVLCRIVAAGDDPLHVAVALRRNPPHSPEEWGVPPLPPVPSPGGAYDVTIADLGDFDATRYTRRVTAWARATWHLWGESNTVERPKDGR